MERDTKDLRHNDIVIPYSATGNISYGSGALIIDCTAGITPGPNLLAEFQGTSIQKKRLQARFLLEGASAEHDHCRVFVVVEKEIESGAVPQTAWWLHTNTQASPVSPWNQVRRGQYKVLYDKTFTLTAASNDPSNPQVSHPHYRDFKIDIPIKKKYQTSAWRPSSGDFSTNRIFIVMVSDSAAVPHPGMPSQYSGQAIMFYDS